MAFRVAVERLNEMRHITVYDFHLARLVGAIHVNRECHNATVAQARHHSVNFLLELQRVMVEELVRPLRNRFKLAALQPVVELLGNSRRLYAFRQLLNWCSCHNKNVRDLNLRPI